MAKRRAKTRLDNFTIAAGSALGRFARRIDDLTKRREAITAEIQRYVRQAEGTLRGLTRTAKPARRSRKAAGSTKKTAAKKAAAKRK